MFAYAKNMQLAVSDKLRRAGFAAGAGVVLVLGAGFLLAALWTFLAYHLGWGSMVASLVIGGFMVAIGLILVVIAGRERHPVPSTEDLRIEVEQQINLMANTAITKASDAADAAMDRAASKAGNLLDLAENKVHSVADNLTYRANRFADQTEARVYGSARRMGENAARRFGFASPEQGEDLTEEDRGGIRATNIAPVLGLVAVGLTLASRYRRREETDHSWPDEHDSRL
ncbi:phage holin family protein [Paracoccus sp. MBLB3053]|uniref:Phage holin family protein n=1 Tax=Paracoccus aurantius TaxID=3073814 RepID=A0ABU2HU97_9RHOB|nr:phage holin family protein [Paracoccus sp. MBLB3053]MDS9468105.1 phage holin family protein [Paracoccus sp. MBLB3053]